MDSSVLLNSCYFRSTRSFDTTLSFLSYDVVYKRELMQAPSVRIESNSILEVSTRSLSLNYRREGKELAPAKSELLY